MIELVLSGDGGSAVSFRFPDLLKKVGPEPYESWNLLPISVSGGAWEGKHFPARLLSEEIRPFLQELLTLIQQLKGSASLSSMEGWIELKIEGQGTGKFSVTGVACDLPGTGNKFSFSFETDQSFLQNQVSQIRHILQT